MPLFPLMAERKAKPGPLRIPWPVAERAWSAYVQRCGTSQSLECIAERGGFGWVEMDTLLPEWRELTDEWKALATENAELKAEVERLKAPSVTAPQPPSAEGKARPTWERVPDENASAPGSRFVACFAPADVWRVLLQELPARRDHATEAVYRHVWDLMIADVAERAARESEGRDCPRSREDGAWAAYQDALTAAMRWRLEHQAQRMWDTWDLHGSSLGLAWRCRLHLYRRDGR
ncbi:MULTISPECIES: hypothetical protein [Myxococcus]|uniref:hypothetical protein n=1 Tax=Myxococcus TaxID=32 RepID=UPI001143F926|nr:MULTISPECIES: hypothetical protein [Myxococcus]NOK05810.1 hypothetical protein [Myxococcus xanthus]